MTNKQFLVIDADISEEIHTQQFDATGLINFFSGHSEIIEFVSNAEIGAYILWFHRMYAIIRIQ